METLTKVWGEVKKFSKVPKREIMEEKAEQELEATAANLRFTEAKVEYCSMSGACYNLFCQLLAAEEPQVQWNSIVAEVHNKDPWVGLDSVKQKKNCMKTFRLLEDCMVFHKLRVFNCDVAEHQTAYMIGSLKKPHQMTIQNHMSRCETLNGYITLFPMLRDSESADASTENGIVAFNDTTSAGIIPATCPIAWHNQYKMNHRTVPESPRAML